MATSFSVPFNNISTTVAQPRNIGDLTLVLASASGIVLSPGQWTRVSLFRNQSPLTILRATAVSGNTLTISGPIEGFGDQAIQIGDEALVCDTAGMFSAIHSAVNTLETSYPGAQITGNISGNAASITGSITESQVTNLTGDLAAKATDSLVVHLAGTETITGAKTFSSVPTWPSQSSGLVYAAPSGSSGIPSFRALVAADIPSITESQVTNLTSDLADKATDSLVVHLAGTESITGAKTFSSVPTLPNQSANQVFSGPTTGSAATPAFRSLVAADIPNIAESQVTNLTTDLAAKATDSLVVHLAGTESITGAKTFSSVPTLPNQNANLIFGGPASGGAATPAFRSLVAVDYPTFVASGASHARGAVPDPGVTAGTAKFLREDATWVIPPFDFMGTLTQSVNSITGTATAVFGKMNVCSGTSANYIVTLPSPASSPGGMLGLRMDPALTKIVTIARNGSDLIDGALTRIMWAGEFALLYTDGTNWFKLFGRTIPMTCVLARNGAFTGIADATITTVPLDAIVSDPTGQMGDIVTLNAIKIVRTGTYLILGTLVYKGLTNNANNVQVRINKNADTANPIVRCIHSALAAALPTAPGNQAYQAQAIYPFVATDYAQIAAYQQQQTAPGTADLVVSVANSNFLAVAEIPNW